MSQIRFCASSVVVFSLFILASCSTAPKQSERLLSQAEAQTWLKNHCSKTIPDQSIQGEMILRANTPEFKGQFPASIRVDQSGKFTLEVTNILGGTMAQLTGDSQAIDVKSPTKPKYNRAGVSSYLGIPAKTLVQLIRGELPCPDETEWKKVLTAGPSIVIDTGAQKWAFLRVDSQHGEIPGKIKIEPQKIEFAVEEWDFEQNYAKKVFIQTETGNLKWSWRSRDKK